MRKLVLWTIGIVLFSLSLSVPSAHAQIWEPDHKPVQIGLGYQYSHYDVLGTKFHNQGENASFNYHIFDPLTGASSRLTASIEADLAVGFAGHASGFSTPVDAKSTFIGGGARVAYENQSRIEPWLHLVVGLDHLRFSQTGTLGTENAFGVMGGGGVDFKIAGPVSWRVQVDYLGTHFKYWIQNNYSFGTGVVFTF